MNIEDARALLVRIVQGLYDKRHSPVPGALVKAQLISEAAATGATFGERDYGLKNFLEFVKTAPEIAVQIRIGSDMLLAPATAGDILSAYARPLPRLTVISGVLSSSSQSPEPSGSTIPPKTKSSSRTRQRPARGSSFSLSRGKRK